MSKLRIETNPDRAGAVVELDGLSIARSLTGLTLEMAYGTPPTATLQLIGLMPSLSTEVDVQLHPETRDLLLKLGWTPPLPQDGDA